MFQLLFERSADAIFLFDPGRRVFVDCNQAAVHMMRGSNKEQLLMLSPEDLSPEFQPDGCRSSEKSPEMTKLALANGSHRFEWQVRRFDGTELPIEVLATQIETGESPLFATICRDISERKHAEAALRESEARFRMLFERSADAMGLFDPELGRFIKCNEAMVRQVGAPSLEMLGQASPAEISPDRQPDGKPSNEKAQDMTRLALAEGRHRFEWVSRRFDGSELPIEIVLTAIPFGDRPLLLAVSRDISDRKKTEGDIRQLNTSLEWRVAQRTSQLLQVNEQLKSAESISRKRAAQVQKHRDVLLQLAQLKKSDFAGALRAVCSVAASTLQVARVSYWSLVDGDSAIVCEMLHLLAQLAADKSQQGVRLQVSDAPAYFEALTAKRPIVANRVADHPATSCLLESYLAPLGITSMLDAPVWVQGNVVGVLCHEHVGPARDWTAEEIDFASSLSVMVSLALEESQRARSETRMRESEEKFRALFEASSQGIILHDEEKILEVNPAGLRILAFGTSEEIIGKHPAEVSAPIQPGGERAEVLARKHIQECLSCGQARFDWVARNAHGQEIPVEILLTRIRWGGRQLIQSVFNDISERKHAERVLRESERRLRESDARFSAAFQASPVFITISRIDDGRYVLANDAFLRWTGYGIEEVIGRDSLELGLWACLGDRKAFWDELIRTRSLRERECRVRDRHGKLSTMLISADLIEINSVPHLLTVGLDITQRKQAEEELLKSLALEKELSQLRSSFVSLVSHEFRTPLGIIQSSAEILDDYFDRLEVSERTEHLKSIQKNTRRMAGLMEEVLLIGSLDAGKMEFKPVSLDLQVFTRRLVDEVLSATNGRCPIELALGNFPAEARADERLLRHIFTNLLTNAVKYSEAGSPVRFEINCDGSEILYSVSDRGIGIPEADRGWLFTSFHRGRNVGARPGTGLGLVIVKRCVDLHGGRIKVESQPGEGTTVTVVLPKPGKRPS